MAMPHAPHQNVPPPPTVVQPAAPRTCPHCGGVCTATAVNCGHCGQPLQAAAPAPPPVVQQPAQQVQPPAALPQGVPAQAQAGAGGAPAQQAQAAANAPAGAAPNAGQQQAQPPGTNPPTDWWAIVRWVVGVLVAVFAVVCLASIIGGILWISRDKGGPNDAGTPSDVPVVEAGTPNPGDNDAGTRPPPQQPDPSANVGSGYPSGQPPILWIRERRTTFRGPNAAAQAAEYQRRAPFNPHSPRPH